jgi:NTP pyrophosphatase (non-canonical NTP hydrolase)
MTLELTALQQDVLRVSDIYAEKHDIARDRDWALLKLQEELGELPAEHLRATGRARGGVEPDAQADEAADVLGMLLIYCDHADIDLEAAVRRKWLRWLATS